MEMLEKLTWVSFLSGVRLTKIDKGIFYLIKKWIARDTFGCMEQYFHLKKARAWEVIQKEIEVYNDKMEPYNDKFEEVIQKSKGSVNPNDVITLGSFRTHLYSMMGNLHKTNNTFYIVDGLLPEVHGNEQLPFIPVGHLSDEYRPFGLKKHREWIEGKDCNDSSNFYIGFTDAFLKNKETEKFLKVVLFLVYYHVNTDKIIQKFMNFTMGRYKLVYNLERPYAETKNFSIFLIYGIPADVLARYCAEEGIYNHTVTHIYMSPNYEKKFFKVLYEEQKWWKVKLDAMVEYAKKKEEEMKNSPAVEDVTKEDVTKEDVTKEDSKLDDSKLDDSKLDDSKLDDSKLDDSKLDDSKLDDSKLDDSKLFKVLELLLKGKTFKQIEDETGLKNLLIARKSKKAQELGIIKNTGTTRSPKWIKGENYV